MKKTIVLGVDVGGSHITAALVDMEKGELMSETEAREPLNSEGSADEIMTTWVNCIRRSLQGNTGPVPIGIAVPGPFDYENGISLISQQLKFRSLYGLSLKPLLSTSLGVPEEYIYFMNDACSFLKGEMVGGALRGQDHVMGITLGTGLGSAFSREGEVMDADLWQSPFEDGIAEDFLSTRWFTARYHALSGKSISGVKDLANLPDEDPVKQQVFEEFAGNLSRFILSQQQIHQYHNIVIGGNIAKAAPFFGKGLDRRVNGQGGGVKYCFATLGEKAALIGAAGMAYASVKAGKLV
jgi:glucokinase